MTRFLSRLLPLLLLPVLGLAQPTVNVGSKRFTESYILGEIIARTIDRAGEARAAHQQGLGNTAILFAALRSGAILVYPEYTGTLAFELLDLKRGAALDELDRLLAAHGLAAGVPLGFNNTYALAMGESRAAELGIASLSDLRAHPRLRLGLSQEFLNRRDGWPALKSAYGLPHAAPRGLDHGLAYEALAGEQVDVIDVYSTDAKIVRYRLRVLKDDRGFFPAYEAVLVYRRDLPQRFPQTWRALQRLQGRITPQQMTVMNAQAELSAQPFSRIADEYLAGPGATPAERGGRTFAGALLGEDFWRLTGQHFLLVFVSLTLSVLIGVPLGIWAERAPLVRHWILGGVGVLQTIPALALLAFLIAALDRIGTLPAVVALILYALLPIVRNTYAGLAGVSPALKQSALALGLPPATRLLRIELPLAARTMLAGIKTSAVINVGTATIAAFIGAGGYGERIVAGLAVNDHALLLAGAVPAAAMALAIQGLFDLMDRYLISEGLRT